MPDDFSAVRAELIRFASSARTRKAQFTSQYPTKWHPTGLIDPRSGQAFTDVGAWEWVAEQLEIPCDLFLRILDKPPGKKSYYFVSQGANGVKIYVKLQSCGDHVRGRSFHVSGQYDDEE